ncbi:hypothetical protein NDS46_28305 [Paenibacillus thiaminolyticus]|uniref:hypothetical protein n=1 Tax=Paenibacillus thiaminolyticus TaxID=49283 RepID=UPI00232FEE24|nr:hypothetical protein [Paenibacillus thiaminolyticus]WCF08115.1 hypothetical protein NDS46_28305 [Paenibacillus thiaminolyticus]
MLESSGFTTDQLLPLAETSIDKDLLVLAKPKSPSPISVIWFAVEEIDRFDSFVEFFLDMIITSGKN